MSEWTDNILNRVRAFDKVCLQVKYVKALELRGWKIESHGVAIKMVCNIQEKNVNGFIMYVGSSGSLRFGKNKANSRAASQQFKDKLIAEFMAWAESKKTVKAIEKEITSADM